MAPSKKNDAPERKKGGTSPPRDRRQSSLPLGLAIGTSSWSRTGEFAAGVAPKGMSRVDAGLSDKSPRDNSANGKLRGEGRKRGDDMVETWTSGSDGKDGQNSVAIPEGNRTAKQTRGRRVPKPERGRGRRDRPLPVKIGLGERDWSFKEVWRTRDRQGDVARRLSLPSGQRPRKFRIVEKSQ